MCHLPPVAIIRTNRQRILSRPTVRQSPTQAALRDSRYSRPFGQGVGFAAAYKNPVCVRVVGLFYRRCPSAIARLIVPISIDAIQRVTSSGTRPHIGIEVVKGFSPAGAHLNPPSAIIMIFRAVVIVASLVHRAPGVIFGRFNHAVFLGRFTTTTPATSDRINLAKKSRAYVGFCLPALALTKPLRIVDRVLTHIAQHGQSAERLAGQVFLDCLRNGYNLLSHVRTSFTDMMRGLRGVRSALQSPLFYHNGAYGQVGQGPRIQPYLH